MILGADPQMTFSDHGRLVKTVTLKDLEKMSKPRDMIVFEWLEKANAKYRVLPITAILDIIYGSKWKKSDDVIFICSDGFRQSVSSSKLKEHRGLLAIDRLDGNKGFTLVNQYQKDQKVDLGPLYLVWDNLKDKELLAAGVDDVPYKVVGFDLSDFGDQNPNSAPPKTSSHKVKQGFIAFRKVCNTCHTLNGDGGKRALELNSPVSVTEQKPDAELRQWILDPRSINPQSTMVSLRETRPKIADSLADDIIAYLKEMAKNKKH
jgi:mono/diheme cytochrome c family protein